MVCANCFSNALFHILYDFVRIKDKKVGEGTYAVVYQGKCFLVMPTPTIRAYYEW